MLVPAAAAATILLGMGRQRFIFQDGNDNWHMLSHTYTHQPDGPSVENSISGHLFARHLEGPWEVTPEEPYDSIVTCVKVTVHVCIGELPSGCLDFTFHSAALGRATYLTCFYMHIGIYPW
jgi:hypothetical protein